MSLSAPKIHHPPGLKLQAKLGQGHLGLVYRAVRTSEAASVAVKFLTPPVTAERLANFEHEFRQLQRLAHPQVVQVFEYNANFTYPYFVLELLAGQTLAQTPRTRWPLQQLLNVFTPIADLLACFQSAGLTHWGLQPQHLMVLPDGAKLLDTNAVLPLGIRHTLNTDQAPSAFAYLAPEQFFSPKVRPTADLYALGVMLYEAAVGQPILTGAATTPSAAFVEWQQRHRQPLALPGLAQLRATLPPEFCALVVDLLAQDFRQRPTAAQAAATLSRLAATSAVGATAPTLLAPARTLPHLGVACMACRQVYGVGTFFCEACGQRLAQVGAKDLQPPEQRRELRWMPSPTLGPGLARPQIVYGLLEVVPSPAQVRLPLNFILVLDRSQSMAGQPLAQLKSAVSTLIDHLTPKDAVTVVAFSDWVSTPIKAQLVLDKSQLKAEVAKLEAVGKTAFAPALREALKQAKRFYAADRVNRIVLLTDGRADDETAAYEQAQQAHAQHLPILGLGLGEKWREKFLVELSSLSLGQPAWAKAEEVYFIQSAEQTAAIFRDVYHALEVVAQQAKLKWQMAPEVTLQRVWQVRPKLRDLHQSLPVHGTLELTLGDLEEHGLAYLVELLVPPEWSANDALGEAHLSYHNPQLGPSGLRLALTCPLPTPSALAAPWPAKVFQALEQVRALYLQTQALQALAQGQTISATSQLQSLAALFAAQGRTDLAAQTGAVAQQVAQTGTMTSAGRKTLRFTTQRTPRG